MSFRYNASKQYSSKPQNKFRQDAPSESHVRFKYVAKKEKNEDEKVADIEKQMGGPMTESTLSDEQRAAFNAICHWYEQGTDSQQVLTLGGFAGTGKSTLISVLANKYNDERIVFCSYTGKAASVLRRKLDDAGVRHHEVSTLHHLMYYPMVDDKRGSVLGWKRRAELEYDLIVVDEASMLSAELYTDLLAYGIPVLAVGDHGQLPPIFGSFNLMESPQLRLDHIHRQAQHSPILMLSEFVRRFGQIPRLENSMELQVLGEKHLPAILSSLFQTPGMRHNDVGLLCYTNSMRCALNTAARASRWSRSFDAPIIGDQVICLKNVEGTIFNGMRGEVKRVTDAAILQYEMDVLFEDDEIQVEGAVCKAQFMRPTTIRDFVEYEADTGFTATNWGQVGLLFDYGYAVTVHKAQGSELEHAIVCAYDIPARTDFDTKKRWLYTAVTRASKYLVVLQ